MAYRFEFDPFRLSSRWFCPLCFPSCYSETEHKQDERRIRRNKIYRDIRKIDEGTRENVGGG